jgi:hypothetical protein
VAPTRGLLSVFFETAGFHVLAPEAVLIMTRTRILSAKFQCSTPASIRNQYKQAVSKLCRNYEDFFPVIWITLNKQLPRFLNSSNQKRLWNFSAPQARITFFP